MRIVIDLQPCQNGSRGRGIGRYAMDMTKALLAQTGAHEIWLALNGRFPDTVQDVRDAFEGLIDQDRIVVFVTPPRTACTDFANAWRSRAAEIVRSYALEALKPDVVFIPSPLEGLWDDTVSSVEAGPWATVVTLHDLIPLIYPKEHLLTEGDRSGYLHKLQQIVNADFVLAISEFIERQAIDHLDIAPDRIVHTLEGTDPAFRPVPTSGDARGALLAKYKITRPFLLNTSPFEFRKNIEGLLAGFAGVPAALRTKYQLVIIGKMDKYARGFVADRARLEGLARDEVVLAGYVPNEDLIGLYGACQLFLFPSLSEGFGLPVAEAMACGAPVIGSNTTSIPEVIRRADATFDPLQPGEITDAIVRVLTNTSFREELRAWGLKQAAEFTWPGAARRAMDAFERAHMAHTAAGNAAKPTPLTAGTRPQLAFVFSCDLGHSRSFGYARTLLPHLSAYYDVTVITAGGHPDDHWVTSNYPLHDAAWFETAYSHFERVIYNVDTQANDVAVNLIEAHAGVIILHHVTRHRDSPLRLGKAMPHDVQRDLHAAGGFAGLISALDSPEISDLVSSTAGARLHEHSVGLIVDDPGLSAGTRPGTIGRRVVSAMAVQHDPLRPLAFRRFLGIPADVPVIVAYAGSLGAAVTVIAGFRKAVAAQSTEAHLVLSVEYGAREDPPEPTLKRLPGRIHRIANDLRGRYMELLAVGELAVFARPLPTGLEAQLFRDYSAKGVTVAVAQTAQDAVSTINSAYGVLEMVELTADDLAVFIDQGIARLQQPTLSNHPSDRAVPSASEVARSIRDAVEYFAAHAPHSRYRRILASVPRSVRGIFPNADDLADMARAMGRNAVLARPPTLFLDLSAVAGCVGGSRMHRHTRAFIRALLRGADGLLVEPVAHDGTRYMSAKALAAQIIGLQSPGLSDEPLLVRPGDRLLAIDEKEPFAAIPSDTLRVLRAEGVVFVVPAVGRLLLDRPDIISLVAAAVVETARAVPSRGLKTTYAMLSDGADAMDAASYAGDAMASDAIPTARLLFDYLGAPREAEAASALMRGGAIAQLAAAIQSPPPRPAAGTVDWTETHLVLTGHALWIYSLAIINRAVARTLEQGFPGRVRLLPVETDPVSDLDNMPADERPLMRELADRPPPATGREIVISQHYPVLVPQGSYDLKLVLFAWEESEVPQATVQLLASSFDAVISPSSFVTRALIDSGLSIPIGSIGQPTDTAAFIQLGEQTGAVAARTTRKPVIFFHISSCFPRKGADVLLAAWARAFSGGENVRLVIKTFPNPHNTVEADAATLRMAHPAAAPIEIINSDMAKDDVVRLYADADVMVLPSRGEGYNLPALEAMLAGIPLIVTGHGGHRDFCGPREARLIDFRFTYSNSHVSGVHSMWVEPDVDDLAAALRELADASRHEEINRRRTQARASALVAADPLIWLRRLRDLVECVMKPPPQEPARIAWVSTWQVQCGIASYSGYLLGAASPEFRRRITILCDERTTTPSSEAAGYDPVWVVEAQAKRNVLADAIERHGADVVVIQHQDGLISWEELANILNDPYFQARTTVVVLHNPRGLHVPGHDGRAPFVAALRKADRLVVHSVSDMNTLKEFGLSENTALLPHGAAALGEAPPIRALSPSGTKPVIGCHGFFFRHKGIDKLVRAVVLLRKTWPQLRLRLVNARFPSGISDEAIIQTRKIAEEAGIADAIEWHTTFLSIERITELLRECDLLVLPYDESQDSASGAARIVLGSLVPVLVTRVQIFEDLKDAVARVDSNDPTLLGSAIDALLRDREARVGRQQAQRDWLAAHDWGLIAKRLEGMVDGLVAGKRLG